jgi:DNA repair protein RadC
MSGGLKDRGASPEQTSLFIEADHRSGHRQRLKDRFIAAGPEALPDYELLEMVLFNAISRSDTKPLAKRLIERFGSFAEVINAPPERLKEIKGVGDAVITQLKLVRASALRSSPPGRPCSTIAAPPWASRRASSSAFCSSTRKTG